MTATLHPPGSDAYRAATAPLNSSAHQAPAFVAAPHSAADLADAVGQASARGLVVRPQATGHGAGGEIGDDTLLVDTSGLDALTIDPQARTARVGAGRTWGRVQPEAFGSGLLGLAGSSPSVAVAGYTFGGGMGWLGRAHGMASSALRRVEYVDGAGTVRVAAEEAVEQVDRDALWAFRGGGGVGVATSLDIDLVAVPDLHAGTLLWPVDRLREVVAAWAEATGEVGGDVASSIGVLRLPPEGPFPADLLGARVVHLALASPDGAAGARPLLDRVRAAARPAVDTWGPSDADRLARIHLDPPAATSALGDARWLDPRAPGVVADALSVAADPDSPLPMVEIRSVGTDASPRPGAMTSPAGPFVVHAVGALERPEARDAIEDAIARIRAAVAPADLGLSVGSWMEGRTSVPDALPPGVRDRVRATADEVDPRGIIARSRFLA